jgi:hypothetical protein
MTTTTDHDNVAGSVFALRIVDRLTGAPLRANGRMLTIFTRTPVAAEALRDRDATVWRLRAERLGTVEGALRC